MYKILNRRTSIRVLSILLFALIGLVGAVSLLVPAARPVQNSLRTSDSRDGDYIKWIDFNVPYAALKKTMELDISSHREEMERPYEWIKLLAYLASKYGNNFSLYKGKDVDALIARLEDGESMESITEKMQYYEYYVECYTAILGGFLGDFSLQEPDESGRVRWTEKYGLRVFSPIANGYWFSHFDDFGNGRSYGYQRKHLGHDLMSSVGTPIIAVETGIVEEVGWNRYGGWRVGIRSLDGRRYYYYAHLRQKHPYHLSLTIGNRVLAGDVIGYMGRTGYSTKEGVNNVTQNHLHWGLEIIFHPSQKDGENQIWIDLYSITKLLHEYNKSEVLKDEATKDYHRVYRFRIEEEASWRLPPRDFSPSDTTESP